MERHLTQGTLVEHATRDALTGLWNRRVLLDRLDRRTPGSVLFSIDVARFKLINDTLGHHVGDELLRAVTERLGAIAREGDVLARLGGDEIALLAADVRHPGGADAIATLILRALETPFELAGTSRRVRASVGVAVADGDDDLLAAADLAMSRAKAQGGGCFATFDDDLRARRAARWRSRRRCPA